MTGEPKPSRGSGSAEEVDRMVRENLGLVYAVARRLERPDGSGPERADLVSAGVIGLIQAAQGFEPERGLAFSTIAVTRVQGAMLDEIRRWDHAPRSVRRKERLIRGSEAELRIRLEREPTRLEVAEHLEISPQELQGWYDDVGRADTESLDAVVPARGEREGSGVREVVADDGGADVVETLAREQALGILREKLMDLPERERTVLALYYLEGLRLREIAQVFGVTESRISQIRHGALRTLRSMMTLSGVEEA